MNPNSVDVLIIGAGPAGSTAAYFLAKVGLSVILADKVAFPREKVCGDGLIPDSLEMLRQLGCLERVQNQAKLISTMRFYSPKGRFFDISSECLTIKRQELDFILHQNACEAGAIPRLMNVRNLETDDQGVIARDESGDELCRARFALIATGANIGLLRRLGMVTQDRPGAVAIRFYAKSSVHLDSIVVQLMPDSGKAVTYAWIFPLPNQEYNIGIGVFFTTPNDPQPDLKKMLHEFLTTFPDAQAIMAGCHDQTEPKASMLRTGLLGARMQSGRVLAIGETIGTTFPLTGEGIGKAMESAKIAAQLIKTAHLSKNIADLNQFENQVKEELSSKYAGYKLGETWVKRRWFIEVLCRVASRSPWICQRISDVVSEKVDLKKALTFRRVCGLILRSLK